MLPRIASLSLLPEYRLDVAFDDGRRAIYDVKQDMQDIPSYRALESIYGLFPQVQVDESRTCIYWNDEIDLPSDILYEYGVEVPA